MGQWHMHRGDMHKCMSPQSLAVPVACSFSMPHGPTRRGVQHDSKRSQGKRYRPRLSKCGTDSPVRPHLALKPDLDSTLNEGSSVLRNTNDHRNPSSFSLRLPTVYCENDDVEEKMGRPRPLSCSRQGTEGGESQSSVRTSRTEMKTVELVLCSISTVW